MRRCEDQDGPAARLVDDLDRALARKAPPAEVAYALDRLLEEGCSPATRGWVVEVAPDRFLGLRAFALERCRDLPAATIDALRELQGRLSANAARLSTPLDVARRFPFSPAGAAALRALLSRGLAAGDLGALRAHLEELERLHPREAGATERAAAAVARAVDGDAAGAARALDRLRDLPPADDALRAALVARTEALVAAVTSGRAAPGRFGPEGVAPVARWTASLDQPEDPSTETCGVHPVVLTTAEGERCVVASTGARLVVVDAATGEVRGRLPLALEATSRAPEPTSRFAARVAVWGGLAVTPLVLERWLAPARAADGARAGDFAGRFYSLVACDSTARLLWWDGDAGPRVPPAEREPQGAPPGVDDAPLPLVEALRRGHVLAVASDAQRVYVALLGKSNEPELALFAYERAGGSGQALVLQPAWSAPVPLFAAERPAHVSPDDEAVAPELAAALVVDGAGRLLVTTDVGLAACVDAASGELRWLVRPEPSPQAGGNRAFRRPGGGVLAGPAPEPARLLVGPDGPAAVFVVGDRVLCARLADGSALWHNARGRTSRVLVTESKLVVAYGEQELAVFDASTGALRNRSSDDRACGEGVTAGAAILLPVREGAAVRLRRIDLQHQGVAVVLRRGPAIGLPDHVAPANLSLTPAGVLVGSGRGVSLLSWER